MMHGRNAQVTRIYRILNLLEGAPHGLSAREIWQRLAERDRKVSKRTVYRDLEALGDAGFPLSQQEERGDEGATRWVLERGTRSPRPFALTARDLFALHVARGLSVPFFESVFRKIEDRLGGSSRNYFGELASEVRFEENARPCGASLDFDLLETVRAACAERQVLAVDYESARSGTRKRRRLGPHYVYFAKGSAYLIAEDLDVSKVKVFALPRMSNVEMEETPYDRKPVDHEKFFRNSFGVFRGDEAVDVKVRFAREVAAFVRERGWHASQKFAHEAEGGVSLSMRVAITPELVQWVLGFGPDAQVLEPENLRVTVAETITKMAERYRKAL